MDRQFLHRFEDELNRARYEINEKYHMGLAEVKARLAHIAGIDKLTVEPTPRGDEIYSLGDVTAVVQQGNNRATMAYLAEKLSNPFERAETMSALDRIKEKAMRAKGIAPAAIKAFEADLDGLLAEESEIEKQRAAAVAPHHEAIAGVKGELDGLKSAIDILSNDPPA